MKRLIINQKSYLNYEEILKYKIELEKIKSKLDIILFPSIIYLSLFINSKIKIGTQNFYSYNYGSFTGEINLESLKEMNIKYTLVSHSERKKFKLENYELIREKVNKSLNSDFITVLCVGEKELTRKPFKYIKKELDYLLKGLSEKVIKNLIIAYEPSFIIESEESQCIDKIKKVTKDIKEYFNKNYNINMEVLYGGSVNKENIISILEITDGVMIGKLGIDIKNVKELIKNI